jgi:hypothetical protein
MRTIIVPTARLVKLPGVGVAVISDPRQKLGCAAHGNEDTSQQNQDEKLALGVRKSHIRKAIVQKKNYLGHLYGEYTKKGRKKDWGRVLILLSSPAAADRKSSDKHRDPSTG